MSERPDGRPGPPGDDPAAGVGSEGARSRGAGAPGSIRSQQARRAVEAPTHPKMAATLLMVGIVVLLVAIAAAPLLGR